MIKNFLKLILFLMVLSQKTMADVSIPPPDPEDPKQEQTRIVKVEGYQDQEYTYGTVTLDNDNKITGYVYLKTTDEKETIVQEEEILKPKSHLTGEVIVDGRDYYFIPKESIKKVEVSSTSKLDVIAIYGTIKDNRITAYDFKGNLYQLKVKP